MTDQGTNQPADRPSNQRPNLWDERYGRADYVFGTAPNDFLRDKVTSLRAGTVCCIGDGEGRNGVYLAEQGFAVTSVDLSAVGLGKAEALAARRGVGITTVVANLAAWAPSPAGAGPWDDVVSIFCHLPSAVRAVVYPALVANLDHGGVFLLEAYTPAQIGRGTGGPDDPDLLLTAELIEAELAGLHIEHLEELERDVSEGDLHTGIASVVQCIARKP